MVFCGEGLPTVQIIMGNEGKLMTQRRTNLDSSEYQVLLTVESINQRRNRMEVTIETHISSFFVFHLESNVPPLELSNKDERILSKMTNKF